MRPVRLFSPTSSVWTRISRTSVVMIWRWRSGVRGPLSTVARRRCKSVLAPSRCASASLVVLKRRQEALARPGVPCLFTGNLIKLPVIRALVNAPFAVLAHNGVPLALQGIELPLDLGKLGAVSLLLRTRGLLLCREQLERFGRMV